MILMIIYILGDLDGSKEYGRLISRRSAAGGCEEARTQSTSFDSLRFFIIIALNLLFATIYWFATFLFNVHYNWKKVATYNEISSSSMSRISKHAASKLISYIKKLDVKARFWDADALSAFEFYRQMDSPKLKKLNPQYKCNFEMLKEDSKVFLKNDFLIMAMHLHDQYKCSRKYMIKTLLTLTVYLWLEWCNSWSRVHRRNEMGHPNKRLQLQWSTLRTVPAGRGGGRYSRISRCWR